MIYLDSAATTKPYPEVIKTIVDVLENNWGNASSAHSFGNQSKEIVENVRDQIAADIGCDPEEIIFTGSGCEANSLAIDGVMSKSGTYHYNLFTTRLEHASIEKALKYVRHSIIENDDQGFIHPETLRGKLFENEISSIRMPFVSIGAANSEIGTIQNIKELAKITHNFHGIFHCDMTSLYPHMRVNVRDLGLDMMTISGQKFGATEGVGFLYVRKGIELHPIIHGSQENGLRGGSYNTAFIAGMGKALEITRASNKSLVKLSTKLCRALLQIEGVHLNGSHINRLPNNINCTIDGVNADTLLTLCDMHGICISKGSACQSYNPVPSSTLKAIGLTDEQAQNTIRISIGENNTEEEIDYCIDIIPKLIKEIRLEG